MDFSDIWIIRKKGHDDPRPHVDDPFDDSKTIYQDEDSANEAAAEQVRTLLQSGATKPWALLNGDGNSIISADEYLEAGFPKDLIQSMTKLYKSNTDDPKQTMFDGEGNVLPEMQGVNSLSFHWDLATLLGIKHEGGKFHGRGSQANEIAKAFRKHFKKDKV